MIPCVDTTTQHPSDGDNNQQGDIVMDDVIISCTVGDEEALVHKASSCAGSRGLVRQNKLMSTKQPKLTNSGMRKFIASFPSIPYRSNATSHSFETRYSRLKHSHSTIEGVKYEKRSCEKSLLGSLTV